MGSMHYGVGDQKAKARAFRRSLFVVGDMKVDELFTAEAVRSIRPDNGLHTRHLDQVLNRRSVCDIRRGGLS